MSSAGSSPSTTSSNAPPEKLGSDAPRATKVERVFVAIFMGVAMLGPILLGECYPFSIAPMFCEQPTCYCEYAITGPNGEALSLEAFGLQRIYDGNPVGLGVGIVPPETLDRFGEVPTRDQVISHVQSRREAWGTLPYVDVSVEVIGDLEGVRVGRIDERSFIVRVQAPGDRP